MELETSTLLLFITFEMRESLCMPVTCHSSEMSFFRISSQKYNPNSDPNTEPKPYPNPNLNKMTLIKKNDISEEALVNEVCHQLE